MPPETLGAALRDGRRRLEEAGIELASLDARLLLQHAADVSHEELIADSSRLANPEAMAAYRSMLQRRSTREPVSRITGQREFYGRPFAVTPAVLDPRPDTETLIEAALAILPAGIALTILDLGTGSGAIIVTLLAERPQARGTATDLSPAALEAAKANAARHGVGSRLELIESDWWQGVSGRFDVSSRIRPTFLKRRLPGLLPRFAISSPGRRLMAVRTATKPTAESLRARWPIFPPRGASSLRSVTTRA